MDHLEVTELDDFLARDPEALLLDVREPFEFDRVRFPNARLIPLGELAARAAEALPDREQAIVIYCHHGIRSVYAGRYLEAMGFSRLYNLRGGIDAYARQVDPTLPLY